MAALSYDASWEPITPQRPERPATPTPTTPAEELLAEARRLVMAEHRAARDAGRKAKAAAGGFAYGSPPYGWRADKAAPGGLVPVLDEQLVIQRLVGWRREGVSMCEMTRRLNAEGVPPKRKAADRNSPRGDAPPVWSVSSVRRVLARHEGRQLRRSKRWAKAS